MSRASFDLELPPPRRCKYCRAIEWAPRPGEELGLCDRCRADVETELAFALVADRGWSIERAERMSTIAMTLTDGERRTAR